MIHSIMDLTGNLAITFFFAVHFIFKVRTINDSINNGFVRQFGDHFLFAV